MTKIFSVILPVLNEAAIINSMMDHLEDLEGSDQCECIVVDGTPDGSTIKAVIGHDVYCMKSPQGRARQMNAGAAAARGEILIFLHADTRLPRNALNMINQTMTQQTLIGGAFDLRIDSERPMLKIIARIASLRSRLTRIPYGDQAIFIRRDYFNQMGRYPEILLMEDVALMRRIKKAGGRIGFIAEPVITSARRWENEGIFYATARNWILLSAYILGVSPGKLAKYYRSRQG
ncbi:MAG: glycosyltransferase [Deltaproteobacteria bacterium]|nr:MAG: glycosyltransferase [Deltaproteobacteria bacterium]